MEPDSSYPMPAFTNVIVVIPALNEEVSLPEVISRLKRIRLGRIRVVDNGSSDRTAEVAWRCGAEVISEPRRGYGQACWAGCENLPPDAEWILFCNADGSDDIERVPAMMRATRRAEFVLGNRLAEMGGAGYLTKVQRFGNRLITALIRWLFKEDYSDLGPLRLISRRAYEGLKVQSRGFGWTVEMQVRAAEEGTSTCEIPVRNFPRMAGAPKISGTVMGTIQAATSMLCTLASLWLKRPFVQRALSYLAASLLLVGTSMMLPFGDFAVRENVPRFLIGAAVMGAGYGVGWLLRRPSLGLLWSVAVGTRLILLFMHPGNDIWRYIWEGRVTLAGYNPYHLPPNARALKHLRDAVVWPRVDRPTSTAVYPPAAQLCFALMAALGSGAFGFKLLFAVADLGVMVLLLRRFGRRVALAYGWNPLVIYSFAGGGHYDSLFVLPLLGALLLVSSEPSASRFYVGALLLGSSIAMKWASGPLVFWWLWRSWRDHGLRPALWTGTLAALPMVAPLAIIFPGTRWHQLGPHDWVTYSWSMPLVPGAVRWLTGIKPHDQIYLLPLLCVAAVIAWRVTDAWRAAAISFFSLLVLTPAIQGWYFTWFIAVAACVPVFHWSARLVGLSGFVYFWVLYVDATQAVWKLSPQLTMLLWLPSEPSFRRIVPAQASSPIANLGQVTGSQYLLLFLAEGSSDFSASTRLTTRHEVGATRPCNQC
ncbi:MAG: glycosyltransferase family 2 protein [Acidobacteria bacterium]|nr:MAG: glycosyltransferase family 2 protein [Acidobacteriota bacterium]